MDRRSVFIAGVLLLQGLLPLHYYLGFSDWKDERFAWRMFSPVRMLQCDVRIWVDEDEVDLRREFHSAWVNLSRRGRPGVVEGITDRTCATAAGRPVRRRYSCRDVAGEIHRLDDGSVDPCL